MQLKLVLPCSSLRSNTFIGLIAVYTFPNSLPVLCLCGNSCISSILGVLLSFHLCQTLLKSKLPLLCLLGVTSSLTNLIFLAIFTHFPSYLSSNSKTNSKWTRCKWTVSQRTSYYNWWRSYNYSPC